MKRWRRLSPIAVVLAAAGFVQSASAQYGVETETGAVGDLGSPNSKKWVPLICQPGQYVAGAAINQGGWLAGFKVICASPNPTGGWSGDPVEGGSAGSSAGTHDATLMCPRDTWVSGLSGRITTVYYGVMRDKYVYLADPVLRCSGKDQGSTSVRDEEFSQEQRKNINSAKYMDSPARYCSSGSFANVVVVAIGGKNHPDVRAAKLRCSRMPGM